MSRLRSAALLAALAAPAPAFAGEFIDTRLSFVLTDDDVLHDAGETTPSSPSARVGANRNSNVFFDNYDTKFSGFESLTNLALYKKEKGLFKGTDVEGALHLLFLPEAAPEKRIQDSSSYLRLAWRAPDWSEKEAVSLTAFPISADRFRLGYSYRLSWGGTPVFPRAKNSAPGMKVQVDKGPVYGYAGLKTTPILNGFTNEEETYYGYLAGAGWDITENLRVEAGGGFFQRGVIEETGDGTAAYGGSAQVTWHVGMPISTSVDFKLYRNDPNVFEKTFSSEKYDDKLSYSISAEVTYLRQLLLDPDEPGSTVYQPAMAGDLQARVRWNNARAHLTGSYRDLTFVLFNVPSVVPYTDVSAATEIEPEFFLSGGFDWYFDSLHMTPGLVGGVMFPASAKNDTVLGDGQQEPADVYLGSRTQVIRDEANRTILPANEDAAPIYSVKLTNKVDLSESFTAIGEVFFVYDDNRASVAESQGDGGVSTVRVFTDPEQLGFNLVLQARF